MSTLADDFDQWWAAYPLKVGKLAAVKAYGKARTVATQAELLEGVAQYRRHKPVWADWAHAKTWLGHGRWMDQYEVPSLACEDWWEECKAVHGGTCEARYAHGLRMQVEAAK